MSIPERIQKFYLGFYGRPADAAGYAFWLEQANGAYFNQDSRMAAAFGSTDQAEFRALYGQQPVVELFVSKVYENLFGRAAEVEGVRFFRKEYDNYIAQGVSEDESRALLIARIIDGAQGGDRLALVNKVEIAQRFTDEMRLKLAAISDTSDLKRVQDFFVGNGDDAWKSFASDRVPILVDEIQANDSVTDYISMLVASAKGPVPMQDAKGQLVYSRGFLLESNTNNGQISGSIQITVQGDTFAGPAGSSRGTVSGVPAGLTASLVKTSDTTVTLSFNGRATAHDFTRSTAGITVGFTDADFQTLKAADIQSAVRSNIGLGFVDSAIYVLDGLVMASGEIGAPLSINLTTNTLSLGTKASRPIFGTVTEAIGADLSNTAGVTGRFIVNFVGNSDDNVYLASYMGDRIRGMQGNDTLVGGSGKDTFIFESSAQANGIDTIRGFSIPQGDVLSFAAYLNKTGTSKIKAQTALTPAIAWANGDVLVYQGSPISTPLAVSELFSTSPTDTAKPFLYPVTDGKAVIITASVSGDARIWYLKKEANISATFSSSRNVVTESDISLVGILEGVSNLSLVGFAAGNFS
jgi:hypothetical protein